MSNWSRFLNWVGISRPESAASAYNFAGASIDPDDHLYRKLTERSVNDLPSYKHDQMLAVAAHLDRANPVAGRILGLITDFVFAEGIQMQTRNQHVADIITAHWDDWINDWNKNGPQIFRLLLRDGEVLLPAGVNPVNGFVRWGQLMSRQIKTVHTHPNDWRVVTEVEMRTNPGEPDDIRHGIVLDPTTGRLGTMADGESEPKPVLLLRRGNVDGIRGISFLYSLADFLQYLDRAAFSEVERLELLRAFIWDVTVENATPDQIRELARDPQFATPPPGSVRMHNKAATWAAVTPKLETKEAVDLLKFLLNTLVLGSAGIPEHWFGSGGDVNRAVGTVMNEPTVKMLSQMQRSFASYLNVIIRFVLDQAIIHGALPELVEVEDSDGNPTGEMADPRDLFEIVFPDMDTTDIQQSAEALKNVTESLAIAEARGWITPRTLRRVYASVVSMFGPDVDGDEEGRLLEDEREDRGEPDDDLDIAAD